MTVAHYAMAQTSRNVFLSHRTVHSRVPGPWVALHHALIQGSRLPGSHTIFTKELQPFSFLPRDVEGAKGKMPRVFPYAHFTSAHSPWAKALWRSRTSYKGSQETLLYPSYSSAATLVVVPCHVKELSSRLTLYRSPYSAFPGSSQVPLPSEGSSLPINALRTANISGYNVQQTVTAEESCYTG